MGSKLKLQILVVISLIIIYLWLYRELTRRTAKGQTISMVSSRNQINPFTLQNKKNLFKERLKSQCGIGWQEKYKRYHRQAINSPTKQHNYLIYYCGGKDYGCGGYGNRLHAIASLLLLSVLTQRVFLIDWNYSIALQDYLLPKDIFWNASVKSGRRSYWGGGSPSRVTKAVRRPFVEKKQIKKFIINTDLEKHFNKPVEIVTTMWYFADYLKYNKYLKHKFEKMKLGGGRYSWVGCAIDFLFTKTKIVEKRLQNARDTLGLSSGVPYLGVHIRIGDKAFGKVTKRSGTRTKDYTRLLRCCFAFRDAILRKNPKYGIKIFLATDDVNLKSDLQRRFQTIQTLNVTVEHSAIFRKKRKMPSKEGMMGTLLDHFLLAECDFLVLSYSTFGETAAAMGLHSRKTHVFGERCNINQSIN